MLTMKNLFKKKGMIGKIAGVFMMILTLTACGAQPLPEQFDEETVKAEAQKAEAEALRYAMEQEAKGIRAKGLAEAEAIEKKAEAQKKMGEASVLEMYLAALPEVVKNAAEPLTKTDKIIMYGDGNSAKIVKDVMNSAHQVVEGVKESTGIDSASLLAGVVGGKIAANADKKNEDK